VNARRLPNSRGCAVAELLLQRATAAPAAPLSDPVACVGRWGYSRGAAAAPPKFGVHAAAPLARATPRRRQPPHDKAHSVCCEVPTQMDTFAPSAGGVNNVLPTHSKRATTNCAALPANLCILRKLALPHLLPPAAAAADPCCPSAVSVCRTVQLVYQVRLLSLPHGMQLLRRHGTVETMCRRRSAKPAALGLRPICACLSLLPMT